MMYFYCLGFFSWGKNLHVELFILPRTVICSKHASMLVYYSFILIGRKVEQRVWTDLYGSRWNDVCVDSEINSVSWQQMDCALSYCLTTTLSSVILYEVERVGLYFLWENGNCVCYLCVLMEPCSLKCIVCSYFCVLSASFFVLIWFSFVFIFSDQF